MFDKITTLGVNRGFLQKFVYPKLQIEQFKPGPIGLLLLNNLMIEWFNNIVINKDITVFPNSDDISETFDFAKQLCLERLPFGVSDISPMKKFVNDELLEYYKDLIKVKGIQFDTCFRKEDQKHLTCTVFMAPSESTSFFHQWQKQRRIWWRKFSATPGRYSLTDIKANGKTQNVEIVAKYPWGDQKLEIMTLNSSEKKFSTNQLQCRDGRKICEAHTVTSQVTLSSLFLNTFCDAFDEPLFQSKPRTLLRLHRKLAPYKIAFAISAGNSLSELKNLALYLCRQLRTNNISCLLLPTSVKYTLEAQYKQYDETGIPYNVVLNDSTLKDGIIHLRSRDTTLKEQVHVTNLVTYVEQLFRNY